MGPRAEATVSLPGGIDLAGSLALLRNGRRDPTFRLMHDAALQACWTPEGPATLAVRVRGERATLRAWGLGASWLLEQSARYLGECDRPDAIESFRRAPLRRFARAHPGLRLGVAPSLYPVAVSMVLQQRVTWKEAVGAWRGLALRHGVPAPGPGDLRLPPPPGTLARLPDHAFRELGVERKRARTLRAVAAQAEGLDALRNRPLEQAKAALGSVPGIGPWTVNMISGAALADADAVPVGDFHLPNVVAWTLAGEARGDDRRMLELLKPWAGHRWRVLRLLMAAGQRAPRHGPRRPISRT